MIMTGIRQRKQRTAVPPEPVGVTAPVRGVGAAKVQVPVGAKQKALGTAAARLTRRGVALVLVLVLVIPARLFGWIPRAGRGYNGRLESGRGDGRFCLISSCTSINVPVGTICCFTSLSLSSSSLSIRSITSCFLLIRSSSPQPETQTRLRTPPPPACLQAQRSEEAPRRRRHREGA
ncbi:hypothetical protein B0H13DRAFT_414047 [Mycena leptocephala]|nr:hypothetical protein B0H13DRAFT_414047 [Mycena leptocephala]